MKSKELKKIGNHYLSSGSIVYVFIGAFDSEETAKLFLNDLRKTKYGKNTFVLSETILNDDDGVFNLYLRPKDLYEYGLALGMARKLYKNKYK